MVMNVRYSKPLFVFGAMFLTALPAAADGILEQMQNEVAAIAGRTRTAVVTVEDERAIADNDFRIFFGPDSDIVTLAGARREAEERVKHIDIDRKSLEKRITQLAEQYASGLITIGELDEANREKAHLDLQKASLQQLLATRQPDAASVVTTRAMSEALAQAIRKQQEALETIAKQKKIYADQHPAMRAAQDQLKDYEKQISELQKKLQKTDFPFGAAKWTVASEPQRSGTGFCIGDGYIVTTADVVEGMARPVVITDDGSRIKARVVGIHSDRNIGLLQLQAKADLPSLTLGNSESLSVGHFAISVGNQSGQANSVALMLVGGLRTEGTYSGNRFYPRLIQIAGTVGAGTSGAPLVNARGEAVGVMVAVPTNVNFVQTVRGTAIRDSAATINKNSVKENRTLTPPAPPKGEKGQTFTFRTSPSEDEEEDSETPKQKPSSRFMGFKQWTNNVIPAPQIFTAQLPVTSAGYAIPINDLKPVIAQIREGKVTRGWIGIAPTDVERVVEDDGFIRVERAVTVEGVFPESPAFDANLKPGDILIEMDGKPVRSAADIREASLRVRPGDTLRLILRRDVAPKPINLNVTLKIGPRPAEVKAPITLPTKSKDSKSDRHDKNDKNDK